MEPAFLINATDGSRYPYFLGEREILDTALPQFVANSKYANVVVITNETVCPLYGDALASRLEAKTIALPDGERFKTLETVEQVYRELLACEADRNTLIIALGGGVVGDIAGYAAATFMRGLPFIQAPTSLLAMVDASIGGKVGVNLPLGKNLVGAFKDPLAVFVDISTLKTLPPEHFRAGLAEVIKCALIGDPELLVLLERNGAEPVREIIQRAAKVKIDIVARDPLEKGIRAYLNLGHTFAHAFEVESRYQFSHGEAVAVGLVAAARLSALLGLCADNLASRIEAVLQQVELPVQYRQANPEALWKAMSADKKRMTGKIRFVLLEGIGKPKVVEDVPKTAIIEVLEGIVK